MCRKINRIVLDFFLVILVCQVFAPASHAENDDYALKIALENQLEIKLKKVIMEITGTDRVVIFVNADLASRGGGGSGSAAGRALLAKKKGNALTLPGVPEKTEFGAEQSSQSSAELTTELLLGATGGKFTVSKITATMWIDKSVPDSIVELIKDIAKNVISFNPNRGDQIYVKKVDVVAKRFYWSSLFFPPNLFWLVLTVFGAFLLATVGMFFMDPLKKVIPKLKDLDLGRSRTPDVERTIEKIRQGGGDSKVEIAAAGATGGPGIKSEATGVGQETAPPFSFIRERDVASLAFLMKDKTPQEIAIIVNYLDPALSTRLLELFPKEKQVDVALLLGREEIVNGEKINALEDMVRSRISYIVGGENKLVTLLDMAHEDVRDKVVDTFETKDVQIAKRLRQRIKSLETIIRELPAQGIQALYRNIDASLFAQILKTFPDDLQQKVISSLSAGIAERLKEEMALSRPLSAVRLRKEKQRLMVLVRRLISEGLVEVETNDGVTEVEKK